MSILTGQRNIPRYSPGVGRYAQQMWNEELASARAKGMTQETARPEYSRHVAVLAALDTRTHWTKQQVAMVREAVRQLGGIVAWMDQEG